MFLAVRLRILSDTVWVPLTGWQCLQSAHHLWFGPNQRIVVHVKILVSLLRGGLVRIRKNDNKKIQLTRCSVHLCRCCKVDDGDDADDVDDNNSDDEDDGYFEAGDDAEDADHEEGVHINNGDDTCDDSGDMKTVMITIETEHNPF